MKKRKVFGVILLILFILMIRRTESFGILGYETEREYPHDMQSGVYWTGGEHLLTAEMNTKLYMDSTSGNYTTEIQQGNTITYLGDWTTDRMKVKYGNKQGWININSMPSIKSKFIRYVATEYGDLSEDSSCDGNVKQGMPLSLGRTVWPGDTIYVINSNKNGRSPDGTVTYYVRIEKTSTVFGQAITERYYEGWTAGSSFGLGSVTEIEGDKAIIKYSFPGKDPVWLSNSDGQVNVADVFVEDTRNNGSGGGTGQSGGGTGSSAADDGLGNLDLYQGGQATSSKLQEKAGAILGVIQTIGAVVSVIMLIVIGIKYMLGSVEEKANYKKTLVPYVIGAFLLFTGTLLPQVIYKFMHGL